MKYLIFILTFLLAFNQACSYLTPDNINTLANENFRDKILEIKSQYVQIRDITVTKTSSFTTEEWNDLIIFNSLVKLLIQKLDNIQDIDNLDIDEMKYLWRLTGDSYIKIRKIVSNRITSFDDETKNQLYAFDLNVLNINAHIQTVINNKDANVLKLISNILIITLKIVKLTL